MEQSMTRTLRTALTALLIVGLVAGGAGAAAADTTDIDNDSTTIINDNDVADLDKSLNNISTNVLGVQLDDSAVGILSSAP
jgi:outer membrane receptor protein involved in Fe transport